MARLPKLRKKNGYWMTKAGGTETYFGKVAILPYADARRLFLDHLKAVADHKKQRRAAITVAMLCDLHLDWLRDNRSEDLYKQRQYLLSKWCDFPVGQGRDKALLGDLAAAQVTADQLLAWKQALYRDGLHDVTVQHALAAVKSCWYWAVKHKHLPADWTPFATVEKIKLPAKAVQEEDLLTPQERDLLFHWADADLGKIRDKHSGKYRKRQLHEYRRGQENPYAGFADMMRCYYHTGARTSELADAVVRDFQVRSRKLVLKRHKRTRTMKVAETRVITLNEEVFAMNGTSARIAFFRSNSSGPLPLAAAACCRTGIASALRSRPAMTNLHRNPDRCTPRHRRARIKYAAWSRRRPPRRVTAFGLPLIDTRALQSYGGT
jgi:integrase